MSSTISSLSPLLIFSQMMGLIPFSLDHKSQPKPSQFMQFYSTFVASFCTAVLIYTFAKESPDNLEEVINFVRLIGMRLALIISIGEALAQRNAKISFLLILSEMDEFIENKCEINLNLHKFRLKLFNQTLGLFGFYIVIWVFTIVVNIYLHENANIKFLFFGLIPSLVSFIFYYQVITFIAMLIERVKIVEQLFGGKGAKDDVVVLRKAQILYDYVWRATNFLNENFGLSLLINIINDFITITSILYLIFVFMNDAPDLTIVRYVVEIIPYILNIIFLSHFCDRLMETVSILIEL